MRSEFGIATIGVLGLSMLIPVVLAAPPAHAAVEPATNPPIEQSCGLDLTLVLDASGSVSDSDAVEDVRDAGQALLLALNNTNSTARVTQFASLSELLASRTQIDDASVAVDGALAEAMQGYYNPKPPRPDNVTIYRYNGSGDPSSATSFSVSNSSNQYTNWDQGLHQARGSTAAELMVFVTDGDPTAYDLDKPGDPFPNSPPNVAMNTDRGPANAVTMDRAVEEANAVKAQTTRMLAIGVGNALGHQDSVDRLVKIAGPKVVKDADLGHVNSLNDIDVALVTDFKKLAQFMRHLVLQLCSPSLTVRKLAQTSTDADYEPEQGRNITVTPTVPTGTGFTWILPDTAPAPFKTQPTDINGFAQFQWEPIPPEADSRAIVAEATSSSHTPGRPGTGNNDFRCELKDEAGNTQVVEGEFADPAQPSFVLDPIKQQIVTCTIWNSFKYQPVIALQKVNAPTEVRGDLNPPATVTSTFTATNPGNTPLSNITVLDKPCGPALPVQTGNRNVGDTNGDGLLDPGEPWKFTCTRPQQANLSTNPAGLNVVNSAVVTGLDPRGVRVAATATDDVDVFTPHITLVKTVNGAEQDTITAGESANYQYVVTNTGNTPLGSVTLTDNNPPSCTSPTFASGDTNNNTILDLTETWTYTCTATPTADVVNVATVTATPLNPAASNAAFPAPNPPVTAKDPARVVVVNPGLDLAKDVSPTVVLLAGGANPPPEAVVYTFAATNSGNTPLARPGGGSKDPGWIQDEQCTSDATYVSGDTDNDDLLDDGATQPPGETWTFTCEGSVDAPTLNTATIIGQPTDADGNPLSVDPLTDTAKAFVDVVQPGISVTKTALRPVVLDPDAPAVAGPDTPDPRPAEYSYEVANTGAVPLSLASTPPADDHCAPVQFVDGDADNDSLLDPDEVWVYSCTRTLQRQDAATPPGNKSATVINNVHVVGVPFFNQALVPGKAVTADDSASVEVIEPSLELTKTVNPEVVKSGHDVDYTVTVQNTGDTALQLIGPTDDKCAPLAYQSGDTDGDGLLDGANTTPETWTFTCTTTVSVTSSSQVVTNTASVIGVDQLGNSYTDSDQATVRLVDPAIEITKRPSATLVPAGNEVTYTYDVRNVGTSDIKAEDALASVKLRDVAKPAQPTCKTPKLVAKKGGNQDDILERDPAEVWQYQCSAPINEVTTNVSVVEGIGGGPVGLKFPVADWDAVRVHPFHPGIKVEKSASPEHLIGPGKVTYTYKVTNTGNVPLAHVDERIKDDTCSPVTYKSGDVDDDGLLDTPDSIFEDALDETWVFTCTTEVTQDTKNVVTVSGVPADSDGKPLCGSGAGTSRVEQPCDATGKDQATVTVEAGVGPSTGGSGGPGGLGDTGASPWLREELLLGLLLVAAGAILIAAGGRRARVRG